MAVGGYDAMAMIYSVVKQLNGNVDPDKAMALIKGMKIASPRGPIVIDPDTRDVTQNVYVREVKRVNGKLYNVEFFTVPNVKDPGKDGEVEGPVMRDEPFHRRSRERRNRLDAQVVSPASERPGSRVRADDDRSRSSRPP